MKRNHQQRAGSNCDILKEGIIEFELWELEHEIIQPIPRFKPGVRFEILKEILYWIEKEGFLTDHKIIFAWFTLDQSINIKYRLKWNGTTTSLVRLFIELIEQNILDRSELTSISNKLPKTFSYLNRKGEYVPVQKSAVQSAKNFNCYPDNLKGNEEVKTINYIIAIILAKIKNIDMY